MTLQPFTGRPRERGSIMAYFIVALVILATIASVSAYVVQNTANSSRRRDVVTAHHYAEGAASVAAADVEWAFTNKTAGFLTNLVNNPAGAYTLNSGLSSNNMVVYQRTVAAPFTNQTVTVQLHMTNSGAPNTIRVASIASVGKVTQTAATVLEISFAFGAAIISDAKGDQSRGISKSNAQAGTVVVQGSTSSKTVVDGFVTANGGVNTLNANVPDISKYNYGTENEIPKYTQPGSPNQLFDFNRFIAAAKAAGTHYTSLANFVTAMNAANKAGTPLEGIVAIDIGTKENKLESNTVPGGVNIRGCLLFNFVTGWSPTDKLVNTAAMNINPANLSGLNTADPATFTTGYPPTYANPAKNPANVNISPTYANFTATDDLPALMYNNAILDIHGPANICGVVYSPAFMEIENKVAGQIQYFKGSLIGGGGVFLENNSKSGIQVVSFDPMTLDFLATSGPKGKAVRAVYFY